MYLSLKLILLVFLSTCFNSNKHLLESKKKTQIANTIKCGDLLSRYAKKPAKLSFVNCVDGEGQVILSAKYTVSGKNSKEVEDFLVKAYGIGKLKFVCCGWESKNGKNGQIDNLKGLEDDPNYCLSISMFASAEQVSNDKETYLELDRTKIEAFTVLVQILDV